MGEPVGRPVVRTLIEKMRADPATLDGAVAAVRRQSPLVGRLPEHQVRRHVAALLDVVASAFAHSPAAHSAAAAADGPVSGGGNGIGTGTGEGELGASAAVADRLAFDRAIQGVPLAALLDGFQAGRVYALSRLIDEARAAQATEELFDALGELDAYSHELRNRLIDAYRAREEELGRSGYSARARALRELLLGEPTAAPPEALLEPGLRYHCLIADVTDPHRAAPTEAVLVSGGGVSGFVDGQLCSATPRLPAPERVGDLLVIATPAVRIAQLADAYRAAAAAMAAARARGLRGLRSVTDMAVPAAVHAQPRIGRFLAEQRLSRLDPAEQFHRLLAETALAYLEHGRRVETTAAALHVHPNTVKHRLRRFGALTDFDEPPEPGDTLEHSVRWWWALRAWLE
ncbi:helix-turn-helix domain-containing protein [Actinocrinis sp.]|uniref:helix-turn-helix domain-containing protein n=1 Tax=Actinocrinis sp. TaxID=1920516 RepID=UPI002CAD87C0|nr:helix-turn-helix domain-containing protein [Actinocrinis sp.]HXR69200.1 helix-turn-helix domain-containing protein [Actinocrinis sp.]